MAGRRAEGKKSSNYAAFKSDMKSTIDAAALQNSIAQKYSLPGSKLAVQRRPRNTSTESSQQSNRICGSCCFSNPSNVAVCTHCGYFMSGAHSTPVSLAQHRGLVKPTTNPSIGVLSQSQWLEIENNVRKRLEAICPICMEGFNQGFEVLLSCSHMYHRSCLLSFEKIQKTSERCCPMCRTSGYHKKVTSIGSQAFEIVCCIRIQSNWRGYQSVFLRPPDLIPLLLVVGKSITIF